ncbi:AAA family ATPase [Rubrivivax gelatinosus]|uniref:Adenylate kinase family enzyme n=1 Tax=Rubrivivax gelatinosus TaxID=28068 RepID=A0A4R2M703_RUBGE|nr:AAA family ATPase [Rubrivivax gelatinosus]MBK1689218.1 toxin [Rubrivivax gelatinosus]TCP02060.1 adenylate kinase family enzyme [Rubrivivax gelatinosus]
MRVVVIGTSGAGKSTFAKRLAARLGVPRVELDALHWLPGWTARDPDDFRARVAEAVAGEAWVADGNYSVARDVLWPRATDIVWLNYGRHVVWPRVLRRTVARVAGRQELWAGNRESFRQAFLSRQSILLWSLTTFAKNRVKYAELRADPRWAGLRWHELRTPREAQAWLRARSPQGEARR